MTGQVFWPGIGVLAAVLAVSVAALLIERRRRKKP